MHFFAFVFCLLSFAENWAVSTMVNRISCTGSLLTFLKYFVFGNFTTCQFVEVVKNMGIAYSQEKVYMGLKKRKLQFVFAFHF